MKWSFYAQDPDWIIYLVQNDSFSEYFVQWHFLNVVNFDTLKSYGSKKGQKLKKEMPAKNDVFYSWQMRKRHQFGGPVSYCYKYEFTADIFCRLCYLLYNLLWIKVKIFWEGHKNWQNLLCKFDSMEQLSNWRWRFCQFLWPS